MLRIAAFAAMVIVAITVGEIQVSARVTRASDISAQLGIYDPNRKFSGSGDMSFEHVFIAWQAFDAAALRNTARYAYNRGRRMMVTVEPWTKAANWVDGGDHLFADILNGRFNTEIDAVCAEIADMDGTPLVRWGHEMEEVTGRYPWARTNSAGYIAAYRYFVSRCRQQAANAAYVWSPIGHPALVNYYPGDAYVDLVGLPVWGYQKADRKWYGHDRTVVEAIGEKYARVQNYKKPVIIAELGIYGSSTYEKNWFSNLTKTPASFPLLQAVIYFNMKEPAAWPDGLGLPDWRTTTKQFHS